MSYKLKFLHLSIWETNEKTFGFTEHHVLEKALVDQKSVFLLCRKFHLAMPQLEDCNRQPQT